MSWLEGAPTKTELDLRLSQFIHRLTLHQREGEDTVTGTLRCVSTWPGATLSLYTHRTTGILPGVLTVDTLEQSKERHLYLGLLHCGILLTVSAD